MFEGRNTARQHKSKYYYFYGQILIASNFKSKIHGYVNGFESNLMLLQVHD